MKRLYGSALLGLILILSSVTAPASAARNGTVVASAVAVPAQTYRLSFLTSALVREINVSEGDSVKQGQVLAVLNTPDLEYNVIAAQEALRSAEVNAELQRYKRVLDIRKGKKFWDVVPPEMRQKADAQVIRAQAALEAAQAIFTLSTLTAPQDATVASVEVIPGQLVQQGQVVMTLATLDRLQLETTDLSERDIAKVRIGAPASISIEALNETYNGKVISISPISNIVGGDVVFKVTIALEEQPQDLRWGMTAEVTIAE